MTLEQIAKKFDPNTKPFSLEDIFATRRRTNARLAKIISDGKLKQSKQDRDFKESKQTS